MLGDMYETKLRESCHHFAPFLNLNSCGKWDYGKKGSCEGGEDGLYHSKGAFFTSDPGIGPEETRKEITLRS